MIFLPSRLRAVCSWLPSNALWKRAEMPDRRPSNRPIFSRATGPSRHESKKSLPLLVSGLMNKQVAAQLGITEYTVQVHRGHIMRKMSADSFAALVRMGEKLSQPAA